MTAEMTKKNKNKKRNKDKSGNDGGNIDFQEVGKGKIKERG